MKTEYNSMAFVPEEVEAGLFQKLIDFFLFYNKTSKDHYIDFHVTYDSYCTIVEWAEVPYDHEWGGQFQYVSFDEHVAHYIELPDGSCAQSLSEEEDREIIMDFEKDHPEYHYDWVTLSWDKK